MVPKTLLLTSHELGGWLGVVGADSARGESLGASWPEGAHNHWDKTFPLATTRNKMYANSKDELGTKKTLKYHRNGRRAAAQL